MGPCFVACARIRYDTWRVGRCAANPLGHREQAGRYTRAPAAALWFGLYFASTWILDRCFPNLCDLSLRSSASDNRCAEQDAEGVEATGPACHTLNTNSSISTKGIPSTFCDAPCHAASARPRVYARSWEGAVACGAAALAAWKEEANSAFRSQRYVEALQGYTLYLQHAADAVVFANRAAVHLALQQPLPAVHDCVASLRLDGEYVKAWYRYGMALKAMHWYEVCCALVSSAVCLRSQVFAYTHRLKFRGLKRHGDQSRGYNRAGK